MAKFKLGDHVRVVRHIEANASPTPLLIAAPNLGRRLIGERGIVVEIDPECAPWRYGVLIAGLPNLMLPFFQARELERALPDDDAQRFVAEVTEPNAALLHPVFEELPEDVYGKT